MKDIKRTDQLTKFLDNQIIRTKPFGPNTFGERAYQRGERLVAALHLLTIHIQMDEPVRQLTRKHGLGLLEDLLLLRDEMRVSNSVKIRNAQSSIRELISLTRMLAVSGFVSTQNAEVVIDALDELGNLLNASKRSPLSESVILGKESLMNGRFPQGIKSPAPSHPGSFLPLQSSLDVTDMKDSGDVKDNVKDDVYRTVDGRNIRTQSVLDILNTRGELGIKEISGQLPEYSEKMIQRELAGLVRAGKIRKSGFKRWSKYSIA